MENVINAFLMTIEMWVFLGILGVALIVEQFLNGE
jgi:hypothetical protein